MAHIGQVDVDVVCRMMECLCLNGSVFDCFGNIVTVEGVIWMLDQSRFDEVSLLVLRNL